MRRFCSVCWPASCWDGDFPGLDESTVAQNGLYVAGLIGTLFIDLLKMVLIPLVFTSIAVGVANLRAHRQMHKVWKATLGFLHIFHGDWR